MRGLSVFGGCLIAGALGACQQMLDSNWLATGLGEAGATCHSNAGTYHLPRRLINVTIKKGSNRGYGIDVNSKDGEYVADRNETYCLDFLLSYLAADKVGIQRSEKGLLERVFTKAEDKTKDIAQNVIQAAADLIASERARSLERSGAQPQFKDGDTAFVASFQFDPFVEREAREVNSALSEFGYCLFIDINNDPFAPHWSPDICREIVEPKTAALRGRTDPRAPELVSKNYPAYPRSGLEIIDPRPVPKEVQERGILYRPELSHTLIVLRQKDPGSRRSPWRFAASERIVMPNAAPAFILEVKRAFFVTAETDVQFNSGLIKSVSVSKQSELLALSNLTVAVAQIIVSIPARTFTIFENRAENTKELIKVNAELISTLRSQKHDAEANAQTKGDATQRSTAAERTVQLLKNCSDATSNIDLCRELTLGAKQ